MMPYNYAPDFYTDFYYDAESFALWFEQMWPTVVPIAIAAVAVSAILCLIFYVFGSLSIYTMAERRGFAASFVAWIPFVRWSVLGHVASDVHRARTGKRAFYGTVILLLTLYPMGTALYGAFAPEPVGWVFALSALCMTIETFVMLFALSEVYRDYSRCWVGMLIFTSLIPVLRPIFLLAIHKNVPVSVRMRHAQAPAAEEIPEEEPVEEETVVEDIMQEIEEIPAFDEEIEPEVCAEETKEPAAEEEEFETTGV